ncbi:MAG: CaiB/BaiF CoA transferase family protein [Thiolinea sp.]
MMKPLEGILVISVEQAVAAPLCTARLADAGARVIKIEREGGDFARGYDKAAKGESSYFVWTNQGKESLVLDFKTETDKQLLENMLAKADVFIQNLAPGATERAGFGSEDLRSRYPRLITCDISGYGDSPAMQGMKAYDFLVQAETGLVGISGGENELGRIGVSVCDIGAGMTAHAAIMEALYRRERTGDGAALKVSLFDVAAEWMAVPLIHHDFGAGAPSRQGLRHPTIAPYGSYRTSDGTDTVLSIQNEREWHRFCTKVLGNTTLPEDQRFINNNARVQNREAMDSEINAVVSTLTASEFRDRLRDAGIAYGALNSVAEFSDHPALRRRKITTPDGETVSLPAPPIIWAQEKTRESQPIPATGEHSKAIRQEFGTHSK